MYISQVSQTLYELHFYKDHKLVMHVKIQAQDTWTSSDCPKFPDLFKSMVNMPPKNTQYFSQRFPGTSSCIFNPKLCIPNTNKLWPKGNLNSGASTVLLTNIRIRVPPLIVGCFTIIYQSINCVKVFL